MKNLPVRFALCCLFALVGACDSRAPAPKSAALKAPFLSLVPIPRDISGGQGSFRLAANTDVVFSGGAGAGRRGKLLRRARHSATARGTGEGS
jgi:hypothetical protein